MPSSGISTIGSSAVAGIGTASVSHQITIHAAIATSRQAGADMPSGAALSSSSTATAGPASRPARRKGDSGDGAAGGGWSMRGRCAGAVV